MHTQYTHDKRARTHTRRWSCEQRTITAHAPLHTHHTHDTANDTPHATRRARHTTERERARMRYVRVVIGRGGAGAVGGLFAAGQEGQGPFVAGDGLARGRRRRGGRREGRRSAAAGGRLLGGRGRGVPGGEITHVGDREPAPLAQPLLAGLAATAAARGVAGAAFPVFRVAGLVGLGLGLGLRLAEIALQLGLVVVPVGGGRRSARK